MSSTADVTTPRPAANPTAAATDNTVRPQPMPAQQTPAAQAPAQAAVQPQATVQHAQPAPTYVQHMPPQPSAPPTAAINAQPGKPKRGPVSRFIRSLFSHLLFAGVCVAGVLGYLYHAPILRDVGNTVCADKVLGQWMDKSTSVAGKSTAATVAATTAAVTAAAPTSSAAAAPATITTSTPATTPVAPTMPPAAIPSPVATAPVAATPVMPAAAPAQPAAPVKSDLPKPDAARSEPAKNTSDASGPVSTNAPANPPPRADIRPTPTTTAALDASPRAAGPATTTDATPPVIAPPPADGAEALRRGLADAREAYAAGKTEAVAAYVDLAKRFPDNPDLTGELGNILFQQGKLEEAGEQFYETGVRLVRAKQDARAACLVDVLRQLAPTRARELERMTSATCPATTVR